ncbi:MAG TPA: biotin--[acetyl-CoA-carboxylase] ligase [Vicinamibacterales bacterium]|nr:biotin--[acetyl-CoA-carboxylase] ligase [Vicinamibacterales bacterium]
MTRTDDGAARASAAGPLGDLTAAFEAASGRLRPFHGRLRALESVASTNDEAARLAAAGAPEGTVVVADTQTAGRGRSGRSWFSPPGAGVYVSVVLRPWAGDGPEPAGWLRLITLAAGVAVADGIRAASGLPAELKWPNDVGVTNGHAPRAADRSWRKLAGILAEGAAVGSAVPHVIIGIGINVRQAALPAPLAATATSIEAESGRVIDRGAVLVETLAALRATYEDLRRGRAADVLARWRALSPTATGAHVVYQGEGGEREGVTAGLDDQGALRVRSGARIETIVSGEVKWI